MEVLQKKIFASLEANDVFKANTDMALLCSMLTEENHSTQSIESYISMFCTKGAGVFTYIQTLSKDKNFEHFQSIMSCLNAIYILFNNFPKSMSEYTTNTIRLCEMLILRHPKYKTNAAKIVQLLAASKDIELDEPEVIYMYSNLKKWISDETNGSSSMLAIYIQILGGLSGNKFMAAKLYEIANIILNFISMIVNGKAGEQNLLQGGYSAAQDFMEHAEFSSEQLLLLYQYVVRDMELKSDKRQGSRTVVEFIGCNADVFAAQIQNDIDLWESNLQKWFKSASKDDSKAGYNALIAVYKAVGIIWAQAEELPVQYLPILRRAQEILEKNDNSYEAKLAINTIGYVASAAAKFMNDKDFHDLFLFLLQKIEFLMSDNSKLNENVFTANSCDCVEAISPFLESLHNNIHIYMNQFKRIVILLIRMFPYILQNKHETVIHTIRRMCMSISKTKVELFLDFVKDVVKQGVMWTCSHSLAQEVEIFDLDVITYKRYLPLWLGILHFGENKQLDAIDMALWDRLIKNLIYMSDKLNLNVTMTEIETNNGIFDHLHAEKCNDLSVFANLSDFYCDLFSSADPALLKPWLDLLCDHLIRKSTQLPLISGFYKLLATLMKMFEDIHYFHPRRVERKEHVCVTFENVNAYLKHVLKQVLRVKNDLQMACALLILRMPIEIVSRLHYDFSGVFITAFKLGQHDYQLANIAVDALAKWHRQLNADDSLPLLRHVVPVLDVYLRNQFVFGDSIHVQGRKVKKYAQKKLDVDEEPELIQLQHKILKFLATLPNEICLELNNASAQMKLTKGDSKLLKVNLLIGERSLSLWLDPFLDRVLLLSVESTDRKVRIPACELLHSIVAVFLGTSAQSSITDFEHQLEKILTAMLLLACDQDSTVVSLFNPLLVQMAHWYAHPKHSNSTLSQIFIKSLLDGASNGNNGAVRDLSGTVLREFVAWTCKQNTKDTLKLNLNNIKVIVDYMNQFSLHPDEVRRFGATVIFNNIYRELREEDAIVDAFWLEILYAFVMNLNLVQPAASDNNLLQEIHVALDRVTRCLLQKCSLFQRVNSQRSTPPKFNGNTFDDVASFLLQQTYQLNICCRRKCMEIFKSLPPEIVQRALASFNITSYLHDLHTTPFFNDVKSIEQVLKYFASLTCLIDGHVFIMQFNPSQELADSVLWLILDKLIDREFKKKNLKYLQSMFESNNDGLVRRVKDEFVHFRARLVETLLGLYTVLLENGMDAINIFSDKLGDFLADYMFDYHSLDLMHLSHQTWKEYAINLLKWLFKSLKVNSPVLDTLRLHSRNAMSEIEEKVKHLNIYSEVEWSQRQILKGLAVLRHADSNNLLELESLNDSQSLKTLFTLLGLDKMDYGNILTIPKLKDSQREYFTLRLESMLDEESNPNYEQDFECVLAALCMDRPVYSMESLSTLPQGVLWFLMFKKTILKHTVKPNRLYRTLVYISNECGIDLRIKYFKEFLKYVYNTPAVKGNCDIHQELVKSLEYIWPTSHAKSECLEVLDSNICLELICDLRLIVNRITSEVMLEIVVAILGTTQSSDIQQLDHFTRVTRVLGMVAPRGFSSHIQRCFDCIHSKLHYFQGESKRAATNLFLKTLFEATYYSFCLNFFTNALHFYVMLQNDIEVDVKFCETVMTKMPADLQGVLLNEIFTMRKNYEFKHQLVLTSMLCNLLAYCDYEVFEEFYMQYIEDVIKGFDGLLEDKITRCILINRLFGNIKIDNVENLSCRITRVFCKKEPTGKELLRACGGILFNACKETRHDSEDPETFRLYQCYAYNAAATLICNTKQDKPEWYRKFFMRTEKDQDILWTNLVPSHKTFNFCIISEDIPKKKKVLSDIRTRNDSQIQPAEYIESQNLFLSTLAEDITNYDFINVCVRHDACAINNRGRKANMHVEIDDEDVNQHECMLTICSLVKHMFENDLLPEGAAPEWVHDVGSMLIKNNTPANIRQFLCKMIENSQVYLKCYADILIPGIIRTICDTCSGLNSLATDCIVMLLSTWKERSPTGEDTNSLVEFLMLNLWNDRTDVFTYNVNLLKTTVETYREIHLPPDFVFSLFANEGQFLKTNMAVIHIINILLVNNISPFPRKLKDFFARLCQLLRCNDKPIYTATAETLGLALSFLEEENHSSFENLKMKITREIEILFKDSNAFAKSEQVLESIVKNYHLICNYTILSSLERRMERKGCIDISKASLLRIFLKCIKLVCDLGLINKLPLSEWLVSTSVDIEVVTMEIILGGVNYFTISNAEILLDVIVNNVNNHVICKMVKTDLLIAFYKRFCNYEDAKSKELVSRVKEPLIRGFLDAEKDIRQKLYDFWTELEIVPRHLEEKLLYLLENCYDNSNEELFLTFSNTLILHDLMDNDLIFNVPLHKCEYKDYEVNSSWRVKSASMLPLFTASSQSQQMYLKATQDYEFTQTQILTVQRQNFTQSASVLSFGNMQTVSDDAVFKNPNDLGIGISNSKVKKWRFFKDKAKISKMHAIRESKKGRDILKQKQDAKKMKEAHVKLYRKYRVGDFPDVQIRVQAVTDTLKELCKVDCLIAQVLYKNIFDSVVDVATNGEFLTQGCAAIEKIFTSSANFDSVCIGTFMQIALEHKDNMRFAPNLIKNVATKSGNLFYGCLLLEEYLNDAGQANSENILHWIRLADLYKKLEEWDVVQGIFCNKINGPPDLLLAIAAESENSWEIAKMRYVKLIQNDNDANRRDFYYEAYFKCSEELSDWKEIEKRCLETAKSEKNSMLDALFSSEWNKEVLLPYYIKSQVRVGQGDFEAVLKNAMKDGEKKEVFRNEMSDELSIFYLKTMKLKLARNYTESQRTQFLKSWQCINGTYEKMRSKMLLEMKNCAEISVLLDMYDEIKEASYITTIDKIQQFWMKSTDKYKLIPTRYLTTTITIRDFFIELAKLKLFTLSLESQEISEISKKLSDIAAGANVNIIQEALQQKNFRLAKYFFAKLCAREDAITGLLFSKIVLRSLKDQTDLNVLHKLFKEAFKGYNKCVTQLHFRSESTIAIDAALHLMELCKTVFRVSQTAEVHLGPFREFITACELNRFSDLLNYGFENLRDVLCRLDNPDIAPSKELADAFFTLSNEYADRGQGFENRFIECTLKSMQYGSDKARMAFPRLLTVDGLIVVHKLQFIEQTSKIPTYMFISWIPQLLAYCDTVLVSVLKHIVLNLAKKYPNSLIYAYKCSKKKYTYRYGETRELSLELDHLLHNDLVDKMLIALNYVVVPSTILRTAIDRLRKACTYSEEAFKQAGKEVTLLFEQEADPTVRGEQYEHVLKQKESLMNIIKHAPFNEGIITEKLRGFVIPPSKHSDDLGRYSPWLNYFHGSDFEREIEVPGCYNGNSRPLPHYHPKILKYSTVVKVFHSLFQPIRITIFANDVKEYRFLVKYGEDLRQDQRIQQLFKLMNVALSEDVKCRERKLNVSVYEVIPLTGELGFVQWVENTDMLRSFIIHRSGYKCLNLKMLKCMETHSKRPMGRSKEKVCSDYQQLVNSLPPDMLRKSLSNLCPDLGTFFSLRMSFTRSYAVMCVTNWLLGIGDRHLENILLNVATGHVFGIDFAHAFGSATLQQHVPELVPFRLTPQILNVMAPHKQNGLLQQTMIHTLRVLRDNSDTLFSNLDIFFKEPTINWLSHEGQKTHLDILNLTKTKFQGQNPIRVMMEEIKLRPNKDSKEFYLQCLQDVLDTVHISDENEKLSVQGQVQSLIVHATDSNLLGMMFYGWQPWI